MITRATLTMQTPGALILGVVTDGLACAVTGNIRTVTGEVVTEVVELVGAALWPTLRAALEDVRQCKAKYLIIATSSEEVVKFFTPPINMQPTTKTTVPPLNKSEVIDGKWVPCKPSTVPTGGDNDQWTILRLLFMYDAWKVVRLEKLPNTEKLLKDGAKSLFEYERYKVNEPKRPSKKSA